MADPAVLRAMLEQGVIRLNELVRAYGSEAAVVTALWSDQAEAARAASTKAHAWHRGYRGAPYYAETINCRCAPPPPKAYLCLDCGAVHDVHFGSAPFGCSCGSARFGEMCDG